MVCFYGEVCYIDQVLGKWRIHGDNYSKVLHNDYPKELKYMYSRFKKRFNCNFTKEMRINIYNEIALREALNVFQKSSIQARKKLNKIHIFNLKGLFLRILSYFPKKIALKVLNLLKQA